MIPSDFYGGKTLGIQHCWVVFRLNGSSFLLAAMLNLHLANSPANLKGSAAVLTKPLYVNNTVTSVESKKNC